MGRTFSTGEAVSYPTSKTSIHGKQLARELAEHRAEMKARREANEARKKAHAASPKDVYSSGGQRRDADIDRMSQLNKQRPAPRTREQQLARRQSLMNKGISDERKWRAEAKADKKAGWLPECKNLDAIRRRGEAMARKNANGGGAITVGTMVENGKTGRANNALTGVSYGYSAYKNLVGNNTDQALADAAAAGNSVCSELSNHGVVAVGEAKKVGTAVGLASAGRDFIESGRLAYNGQTADATDRYCSGVLSGLSSLSGPVGVVGKVGVGLDLAMNVGGGDRFLQEGWAGQANAEANALAQREEQAARILKGRSKEQIQACLKKDPSLGVYAVNYHQNQIMENYNKEEFCKNEYAEMVRVWEAVQGRTY